MLGYGLVQVPLNIYNHSRTSSMLSHIHFKLSQLYNEKVDVEERLDSLVDELTKYCLQINTHDVLRPSLEQIIQIVPDQYTNQIALTMNDFANHRITTSHLTAPPTEKQLIRLHERLKKSIHIHHRVQISWKQMINKAFYFDDILSNENNADHRFVKQNPSSQTYLRRILFEHHPRLGQIFQKRSISIDDFRLSFSIRSLEWYTFCFFRPWALRFLGITLGALSLLVIWSEMTFFSTKPVLSIFAQCVNAARNHYNYFTLEVNRCSRTTTGKRCHTILQVFCCLSIAYLCLCAYYTIFRIRILNYFYLSLYHLTDENSLIFAATFLCRLTGPLCYNFLGMIHFDQAITNKTDREETIFTAVSEPFSEARRIRTRLLEFRSWATWMRYLLSLSASISIFPCWSVYSVLERFSDWVRDVYTRADSDNSSMTMICLQNSSKMANHWWVEVTNLARCVSSENILWSRTSTLRKCEHAVEHDNSDRSSRETTRIGTEVWTQLRLGYGSEQSSSWHDLQCWYETLLSLARLIDLFSVGSRRLRSSPSVDEPLLGSEYSNNQNADSDEPLIHPGRFLGRDYVKLDERHTFLPATAFFRR